MPCSPTSFISRRGAAALAALVIPLGCAPITHRVRGPARYHAPSIVLAYPERDESLPVDKAVVVLRFARGEQEDPIDPASFRVTVDGVDRTPLFRVTDAEAWGPLGDRLATAAPNVPAIAAGPHTLGARVCSVRGACGAVSVVIDVRPWDRALGANAGRHSRHHSVPNNRPIASQFDAGA